MSHVQKIGTLQILTATMLLTGTVAAQDVVQLDLTATGAARFESVKKAAATATIGTPTACGVALKAGVAGDWIPVQIQGYLAAVPAVGTTAEGPCCVIGTAGTLVPCVAASTAPVLALGVTAANAGFADVYLLNPLRLAGR